MHLSENTLLHGGIYRIIRFISSGGFGCTYEAEHIMLGKRVAVKEFFVKDFCNRDETTSKITLGITAKKALVDKLRNKFLDEARGVSGLNHPGIVSVSDVFEDNGTAYFVMDYIDGKSLGDMVKEEGFLSEERAVGYIKKVSEALRYVHENKRLHLDLKPGNIMVDSNDNPILIDFGASKQYDEESGENTSTLMGKTPGYAPLEQMGNSVVQFTPCTDIYALGATLYKLLTGLTPLEANLLASGVEQLQPLPATISAPTRRAVMAAMQMDKSLRPQTIDEFLRLLNGEVAPASIQTDEVEVTVLDTKKEEPVEQKSEPKPEKPSDPEPKENKLLPILITAGVIIGVLIGFFVMRGLRSDGRDGDIVAQTEIADSDSLDYFNEDIVILQPKEDNAAERKAEEEAERKAKEQTEKESQDREAQYKLGVEYYNAKDYSKAVYWWTKAAEQGHTKAQCNLGFCYYNGEGVVKDYSQAVFWFTKAAEQGDVKAQYNLGTCYHNGEGVEQDYSKVVYWYTKAAEQGHADAQCNLGICHHNGEGVEQDYSQAVYWYTKAAEQGDADAQYNLGVCYEYGEGVAKDYSQAAYWFTKAAEQGDADAKKNLEILREMGY